MPRALTALVYQYRSLRSARRFAEKFFFSRDVDLRGMMKFRDPKQTLLVTVAKFGRERPVSRCVSTLSCFRALSLVCRLRHSCKMDGKDLHRWA